MMHQDQMGYPSSWAHHSSTLKAHKKKPHCGTWHMALPIALRQMSIHGGKKKTGLGLIRGSQEKMSISRCDPSIDRAAELACDTSCTQASESTWKRKSEMHESERGESRQRRQKLTM